MYSNEVSCVPNMTSDECKCAEPRIQEILENSATVADDVKSASLYIRNNLFSIKDVPPIAPKREVTCARDSMLDICATLNEVLDILNYISSRL